jgi:eukaryotic-like serine/threonine-protein kinase
MTGEKIGKYTLVELIGQGGMGDVWRARDDLGIEVAIKMLRGGLLTGEREILRFTKEAKALSRLNHPNIGKIFGVEQHMGKPCLIMAFEEGVSLRKLMLYLADPRTSQHLSNQTDIQTLVTEASRYKAIDAVPENAILRSARPAPRIPFHCSRHYHS